MFVIVFRCRPVVDRAATVIAHTSGSYAQQCVICGRRPSDAHHLRFAQPRALGHRVGDEYAVPLCRSHHRALHRHGDELEWWEINRVDPLVVAQELWRRTRHDGPRGGRVEALLSVGVIESVDAAQTGLGRLRSTRSGAGVGWLSALGAFRRRYAGVDHSLHDRQLCEEMLSTAPNLGAELSDFFRVPP